MQHQELEAKEEQVISRKRNVSKLNSKSKELCPPLNNVPEISKGKNDCVPKAKNDDILSDQIIEEQATKGKRSKKEDSYSAQ